MDNVVISHTDADLTSWRQICVTSAIRPYRITVYEVEIKCFNLLGKHNQFFVLVVANI